MPKAPHILLVNPWVTDFAAFDLWAKPLGFLLLAALLREGGCGVSFIDCLDRADPSVKSHPEIDSGTHGRFGTGKFPKMRLPKPGVYAGIPRHYHRYGIPSESFRARLQAMPAPDLIWVTSGMTYWYPGVVQTIGRLREVYPETPIWLGGIYAQLCSAHARQWSGATEVVTLPLRELPEKLRAATGFAVSNVSSWGALDRMPPAALDLLPELPYAPLIASLGCPFRCPYCASHRLQPHWGRRSAERLHAEISYWYGERGVQDFAFYDDALLIDADTTLRPVLERLIGSRVRFHTPNALHVRALTQEWCELLYASGFRTLRLGLETTRPDRQRQWGGKVATGMFLEAVERLHAVGFLPDQIGVYLLCGLPGQSPEEVAEAIRLVAGSGAAPYLAEYSPIPGTALWEAAARVAPFDLACEPLYHNNTFFACRRPDFTLADLGALKALAQEARRAFRAQSALSLCLTRREVLI